MARPSHPLRGQFEALLVRHIAEYGEDFERSPLVQDFVDRGVGQATVYRWIDAVLARGREPAAPAPARPAAPPANAAMESSEPTIVPALPRVPRIEDVQTMGLVPVTKLLRDCIRIAQDLIEHSRTAEGKPRNARLLLQGSEHLRKAIETAAKLNETVAIQQEMQQFHRILLEEVGREAPAVQERLLTRIRAMCDDALACG
jgi:hypothetical protein